MSSPSPGPGGQKNPNSAIMDLFGSNGPSPSPQPTQPASASMDLLGAGGMGASAPSPSTSPAPVTAATPAHTALNKDGLVLTLQVQRSGTNAQILARFRNDSNFERFTSVGLQAAVPKSQRLQLSAISKADLESGDEGTQSMRVTALNGVGQVSSSYLTLLPSFGSQTNLSPPGSSCQTSSPSSCHFRPRRWKPCHRPSGLVRAVDQTGGSDAKSSSKRMFNFPMNSQIQFYTPPLYAPSSLLSI